MFCLNGVSFLQAEPILLQVVPEADLPAPANNKPSRSAQRRKSNQKYRASRRLRKLKAAAQQQDGQIQAQQQDSQVQAQQQDNQVQAHVPEILEEGPYNADYLGDLVAEDDAKDED